MPFRFPSLQLLPQLLSLLCRLTQLPEQLVKPAWQLSAHMPFAHTWPDAHAAPHAPQLLASVCVLTQNADVPEPHALGVAAGHAHCPWMHCCPPAHATPHTPQFCASVWMLAQ